MYNCKGNLQMLLEIGLLKRKKQTKTNKNKNKTKQNKSQKEKKKIKIALSPGYSSSYFYNKRCNMLP